MAAANSKKTPTARRTLKVKTTLGDLLAAAYQVAGGSAERAAELLQDGPLNHLLVQRRLRFV